jgi:uncharacterized protein (TIGR02271 family)
LGATQAVGRAVDRAGDAVSNAAANLTGSDDRARGGIATTADADRTRGAGATGTATDKQAIPIVEEQLNVGKREVAGGRVRVHSHVVETPVQEQVNLRQERVDVERRPVDRPVNASSDALFRERTIEAEERVEEPVVSKEARVKEELVVNKDVEQRTETVRDTVRRTEVEVDDERRGAASSNADLDKRR